MTLFHDCGLAVGFSRWKYQGYAHTVLLRAARHLSWGAPRRAWASWVHMLEAHQERVERVQRLLTPVMIRREGAAFHRWREVGQLARLSMTIRLF